MVDTSHVDPWMEPDGWGFLRVIFVTEELQLIDPTFMNSLLIEEDKNLISVSTSRNNNLSGKEKSLGDWTRIRALINAS